MTPQVLVVVQARMGSTRLPGKVLVDIGGRPALELMLARLQPVRDQGATVVVATSDLPRDQPIAELAGGLAVPVVRGDEADVLTRFTQCLDQHGADLVVRLTADCPLIDPGVVSQVVDEARTTGADYTSNTLVRTYPDGLDVEVVKANALRRAHHDAADRLEREHVTPHLYRRPTRFSLAQVTSGLDAGDERWTLDEAADLEVIRDAAAGLPDPTRGRWTDILDLVGRRADRPPLRARPGPAVRHRPGQPYERRWALIDPDGTIVGAATVTIDDHIGTLHLDLDRPTDQEAAGAAIRTWLAADLQTTTLIDHEGSPHGQHL